MQKVEVKDWKRYDAPKHFDVRTLRLHSKDQTGAEKFTVGVSHFLPGGGCEMAAPPPEKVYMVLEGEITVQTPKGEEYTLKKYESIYIGPGEERALLNKTNMPCMMLVIMPA
jgi:quercetin dioxygenase-like cupin family protein